ncbi:MAG: hypothetical protein JWQ28_2638 [Pedobacter sp.]|jgi:hypothetical protein|nr:hypothetical protein [Pedobacter sp.]
MENDNIVNPDQSNPDENANEQNPINEDETQFENPDVDPGFDNSGDNKLTGREDKRTGDIDSTKSISEMRDEFEQKQNDAKNLDNDREGGSYNPKNI